MVNQLADEQQAAERAFAVQSRLISGTDLTEKDLDPDFARGSSLIPNRDSGMNFRCQLYAVSKDESECVAGLLRYLEMNSISEFRIESACSVLINHPSKPLEPNFPVSSSVRSIDRFYACIRFILFIGSGSKSSSRIFV